MQNTTHSAAIFKNWPQLLHPHHLHPHDRYIAKQRASRHHVAHGQEDRALEPVIGEQILVQKKNANVGKVPWRNDPDLEDATIRVLWIRHRIETQTRRRRRRRLGCRVSLSPILSTSECFSSLAVLDYEGARVRVRVLERGMWDLEKWNEGGGVHRALHGVTILTPSELHFVSFRFREQRRMARTDWNSFWFAPHVSEIWSIHLGWDISKWKWSVGYLERKGTNGSWISWHSRKTVKARVSLLRTLKYGEIHDFMTV